MSWIEINQDVDYLTDKSPMIAAMITGQPNQTHM